MPTNITCHKLTSVTIFATFSFIAVCNLGAEAVPTPWARIRNLVADYGADEAKNGEISALLQKAVDDVGSAGGGTVVVPARAGAWNLSRPVFVGYPDVTIAGAGAGTRINGGGTLFLLGLKPRYTQALSAGHFPPTAGSADAADNVFDESVKGRHFGLRTFDGKTRASGFFPDCPFAFGYKVQNDPSGNYWKDYERGAGKPTYWQNWPQYMINLAVRNNGKGPIKGVVCGVGAGGVTADLTRGNIDDPRTVWTIESDHDSGTDLCFKFRTTDRTGKESLQSLLLSTSPAGAGTHRISVQLDFTTGKCRAWYAGSGASGALQPLLCGKLDLGEGCRFKAFEYGAFQLGRVTGRMFSGSVSGGNADVGDWTYCGLSLLNAPRYAADGDSDRSGSPQVRLGDGKAADDAYRFFPATDPALICYLPLTPANAEASPTSDLLLTYQTGRTCDGIQGFGYWLPEREAEPIPGTLTLRDMQLFASSSNSGTAVGLGEAAHVKLENIYEGGGGYHGVGAFPCSPPGQRRILELHNCSLTGRDATLFGYDQELRCDNIAGGGGETMFRLVGCGGRVDSVIITGFVACDYYVKIQAGARGGPLSFSQFCIDNEGLSWAPRKACFYAEPSIDGGPKAEGGNRLSFPGTIYTGSMGGDKAVIELADAPQAAGALPSAELEIDGVDLGAGPRKPARCIVLSHGEHWSGRIRLAETRWAEALTHGLIEQDGAGACRIVSYHDDVNALPDKGTWLEGCHVFRLPGRRDPASGAWIVKTFRCSHSGTYATPLEPKWDEVPVAR